MRVISVLKEVGRSRLAVNGSGAMPVAADQTLAQGWAVDISIRTNGSRAME